MNVKTYFFLIGLLFFCACTTEDVNSTVEGTTKSGSYATMLTISNFLYVVNKTQIITYDISKPGNPFEINKQDVGFDIESLYHHQGLLLIGSANNMYIYSIGNNGIPLRQSATMYSESFGEDVCTSDPIVVKDDIAYVTLSSTLEVCRRFIEINQLRVYDVKDIKAPRLLNTFNMLAPKGLGLGKDHLFVCDQIDGLVVYNLADPLKPVKVNSFGGFEGFDLIINNNLLIVVANDQLLQYDITDETNIKYLSKIEL